MNPKQDDDAHLEECRRWLRPRLRRVLENLGSLSERDLVKLSEMVTFEMRLRGMFAPVQKLTIIKGGRDE